VPIGCGQAFLIGVDLSGLKLAFLIGVDLSGLKLAFLIGVDLSGLKLAFLIGVDLSGLKLARFNLGTGILTVLRIVAVCFLLNMRRPTGARPYGRAVVALTSFKRY
jgi:uncharacterized protein YjbI with pentapeptide repeats